MQAILTYAIIAAAVAYFILKIAGIRTGRTGCSCGHGEGCSNCSCCCDGCAAKNGHCSCNCGCHDRS